MSLFAWTSAYFKPPVLAHAIKGYVRRRLGWFHSWNPKIIQYVSPQVWGASRGRGASSRIQVRDYDLLLSIFPVRKRNGNGEVRARGFWVEFVGNPIIERQFGGGGNGMRKPRDGIAKPPGLGVMIHRR